MNSPSSESTGTSPGTQNLPPRGLTREQVQQREREGKQNIQPERLTPSVGAIVRKNTLTLFNLINLLLAIAILLVGRPENTLFFGVAIINTAMGIFQELRAKKTLDKLSILAQSKVTVIRDGRRQEIEQDEVVLDDLVFFASGNQICADAQVIFGEGFEVDESLLTGEADRIQKLPRSKILSGSFVTSGYAYARVIAVGETNYATALTIEAKKEKKSRSQLMQSLQNIIRVLTVVIIPLGGLLFYTQYTGLEAQDLQTTVLGVTASMIGMIPEGLIMLTGVTLTLGALKLSRKKALVQSLDSIETLARVDVLCLDKTGTITDGTLSFEKMELLNDASEEQVSKIISELMGTLQDDNATARALRNTFGGNASWASRAQVPFSSERKWSGVSFSNIGSYILGAPGSIFPGKSEPFFEIVHRFASQGYRVLCLAHAEGPLRTDGTLPGELHAVALLILSDTIRKEAPDTFRYFAKEKVVLKVISGDDPLTVSTIAAKAGIKDAEKFVDMSQFDENGDYSRLVEETTVFGRVSPQQKRELILALKQNGHTACMTGDGVNDVLAMKEADCSVAMIGGSDAARSASDFVLMSSDFSSMIQVLREGRQVINNIESVSALYLIKTIYSVLLTLIYIFLPFPYPYTPLQMTPINTITVGLPSLLLALRNNHKRPRGKFLANVLEKSVPAAVTVVFCILILQLAAVCFGLLQEELSTMNILLTGAVGFMILQKVAVPVNMKMRIMLIGLMAAFLAVFIFWGEFFMLGNLFTRNAFFYLPLLFIGYWMFQRLNATVRRVEARILLHRRKKGKGKQKREPMKE